MDGVNYTVLENFIAFGLFFDTFSYPSFTHLGSRHFNTFNGDPGLLVQWINSLKDSTIILGCIRDEGTQAMNQQAWEALVGYKKPIRGNSTSYKEPLRAPSNEAFQSAWELVALCVQFGVWSKSLHFSHK